MTPRDGLTLPIHLLHKELLCLHHTSALKNIYSPIMDTLLPVQRYSNKMVRSRKGNSYTEINYVYVLCIRCVEEPSAFAIAGRTWNTKWNRDLAWFMERSPCTSIPYLAPAFETLPVVGDTKPLCLHSDCSPAPILGREGCVSHPPCSGDSPPLLSSPGTRGVIGFQGQVNGLGDAGAAPDQGCKVQRVTLQTEA